jgi:hypothetical protein
VNQYRGRWVFERPKNQNEMDYLVISPSGYIKRDRGLGQANSFGKIFAWLELYPEPPEPQLKSPPG